MSSSELVGHPVTNGRILVADGPVAGCYAPRAIGMKSPWPQPRNQRARTRPSGELSSPDLSQNCSSGCCHGGPRGAKTTTSQAPARPHAIISDFFLHFSDNEWDSFRDSFPVTNPHHRHHQRGHRQLHPLHHRRTCDTAPYMPGQSIPRKNDGR